MNDYGPQPRIRILLVNDDPADLDFYREVVLAECAKTLDVEIHGPDEAGNTRVARALLDRLSASENENASETLPDVIFIDYLMPDINGLEFARLYKELGSQSSSFLRRRPVVLMTKFESNLAEQLDSALEKGFSGYLFADHRPSLGLDMAATARRVYQENERERWAEALMQISAKLPSERGASAMCGLIVRVLQEYCPKMKVFVREMNRERTALKLRAASANIPEQKIEALDEVSPDTFPMLADAARGRICRYNSLDAIEVNQNMAAGVRVCKDLGLHRGISFPMSKEVGEVFGTISMYRCEIDPPFTEFEEHYGQLMVEQIAEALLTSRDREMGLAYVKFFHELAHWSEESELYRDLVLHLHEKVNRVVDRGARTKTTFKVLAPGTDTLICHPELGHHLGETRDPGFSPSVHAPISISALVARENRPVMIDDFEEEPLYRTSNPDMRSELCVPVAGGNSPYDPVLGVLNMESSERQFYTAEDLEYTLALCRLVGYSVEAARSRKFLHNIVQTLGEKADRDSLIKSSISIISNLTGYRLLLFVVLNGEHWDVTNADVGRSGVDCESVRLNLAQIMNSRDHRTIVAAAVTAGKEELYVPDVSQMHEDQYYVPDGIFDDGERLGSQAVYLCKAGSLVVGALSLDFTVANALSVEQRELLRNLARWLGSLILQDQVYAELRKRVDDSEQVAEFADIVGNVWHQATGYLNSVAISAAECREMVPVADSDLRSLIDEMLEEIEQTQGLPTRLKALTRKEANIERVEILDVWERVTKQLGLKIRRGNIELIASETIPAVWGDSDIMEMILYHLLDNAIDACSEFAVRRIDLTGCIIEQDLVEIKVANTGTPVPIENLDKLTRLQFTTKALGSGYGLHFVTKGVNRMDGRLVLRNRVDTEGFEACLLLPAVQQQENL